MRPDPSDSTSNGNPAFHDMPKWRVAAYVLALPGALYFLITIALGNIYNARLPERAAALTPANGFAVGRLALRKLRPVNPEDASGFDFKIDDPEALGEQARNALRLEPTDVRAASVLATISPASAAQANTQSLHSQVLGLSRRALLSQLAAITASVESEDFGTALSHIDQILRLQPETRETVIPYLATLLEYEEAQTPMQTMLAKKPEWADAFWQTAPNFEAGLPNLIKLREKFGPAANFRQRRNDEFLLQALVNQGSYTQAEQLASNLSAAFRASRSAANPLRNGDFSAEPDNRPFDWRLFTSGSLTASIQAQRSELVMSASGGATGIAASQLLTLQPGEYRFAVDGKGLGALNAGDVLSFSLVCADDPTVTAFDMPFSQATAGTQFTRPQGCNFYFLNLTMSVPASSSGTDFVIDAITLERQ